jgi:hypothetical protein
MVPTSTTSKQLAKASVGKLKTLHLSAPLSPLRTNYARLPVERVKRVETKRIEPPQLRCETIPATHKFTITVEKPNPLEQTMTSNTDELWQYVDSNKISWATRCQCTQNCTALQLAPPPVNDDAAASAQLRTILSMAAHCVQNIVFAGEGCCTMSKSHAMAEAIQALGASRHLQAVRFADIADIEQVAEIVRALERCTTLTTLVCPIEAMNAPVVQRLLERSSSLRNITSVVENSTQFCHLRTAAAPDSTKRENILTIVNCNNATTLLLLAALGKLVPPHQLAWNQIRLLNVSLVADTYPRLKRETARLGYRWGPPSRAPTTIFGPRICAVGLHTLHNVGSAQPTGHAAITMHRGAARDAPEWSGIINKVSASIQTTIPRAGAAKPRTNKPAAAPPAPPPEAPEHKKPRRVRGVIATHAQKGQAEIAAEFASGDNDQPPPPPPEPTVAPPTLLCANPTCVNPTIDSSEIHTELVCTNGHETRVHKSCLAAMALRQSDDGECCPSDGCVDGVIAERALVRIDERGGRHVKSTAPPPPASATAKEPVPASVRQPTGGARKSKAAQRKEKKERQRAIKSEAIVATPLLATAVAAEPPLQPPQPTTPLVIDDSEQVRRLASGEVECTRIVAGTAKLLLVKINNKGKKGKKNPRHQVAAPKPVAPPGLLVVLNSDDDNNQPIEQCARSAATITAATITHPSEHSTVDGCIAQTEPLGIDDKGVETRYAAGATATTDCTATTAVINDDNTTITGAVLTTDIEEADGTESVGITTAPEQSSITGTADSTTRCYHNSTTADATNCRPSTAGNKHRRRGRRRNNNNNNKNNVAGTNAPTDDNVDLNSAAKQTKTSGNNGKENQNVQLPPSAGPSEQAMREASALLADANAQSMLARGVQAPAARVSGLDEFAVYAHALNRFMESAASEPISELMRESMVATAKQLGARAEALWHC